MELDVLRELQGRGRLFWEMFPGAKASAEWQRQHEHIERNGKFAGGRSSPGAVDGSGEQEAEPLAAKMRDTR
jgi:hypothetical protein